MKLTPENIAAIERFLTDHEDGVSHAGLVIEYGLRDLMLCSAFLSGLKSLGVNVFDSRTRRTLNARDRREYVKWLREKRERENAERGGA